MTRKTTNLIVAIFFAGHGATVIASSPEKVDRVVYLNCITETTDEYAGVEFRYTIDEAAETIRVSRWGEVADVRFGPSYITYRTLGMATKMNVSINRETWQFTMLHQGGVYVVTGSCRESPRSQRSDPSRME